MKKKVLILIYISILIACKQKNVIDDNAETIKFSFTENPSYEKVFTKTTIIPLETKDNCLISKISQMEIKDDKIFILDCKLNSLYVFNINGKFLNRIGNIGKGPGEYIRPRYFFLDKREKLVKVFDAPMTKLMSFDYTGKFVKEIRLKKYLRGIYETNLGLLGFCSNIANSDIDKKQGKFVKFILFKPDGKVDKYISGERSKDNVNFSPAYILRNQDECSSFVEPFLPNIFFLNNGIISVKYKIDFSGHYPPSSIWEKVENIDYPLSPSELKLIGELTSKYACTFDVFFETKKWILLKTPYKNRILLFNKNLKQSLEFSNLLFSEKSWETIFDPCYLDDNSVYSQANYADIDEMLKINKEISVARKASLNLLLQTMNQYDNPLIIKHLINE
jgi:hypothetical protein